MYHNQNITQTNNDILNTKYIPLEKKMQELFNLPKVSLA